ncbi:N-acetylmuramoyl-L-alanine amidase [Paenibacillus sp. NPDC058071]|uniref:N-acetylmuramoyl-L-alanine amidase family protein n=1 Tax=Paenibacillus sp. NPDC058071 TaxID=3346326 RepID=UPI0036D7F76E
MWRKMTVIVASMLMMLVAACGGASLESTDKKNGSAIPASPEQSATVTTESYGGADNLYTIVIDPGHGGKDPGSTGASGMFEKNFTLRQSLILAELLEQDPRFQVFMTRDDDVFLSTESHFRPNFANDMSADLFISIHGNTYESSDAAGTESYYYHKESLPFAEIMHKHVTEATGFTDRGVKKQNYFLIRETTMPSVLLELGYMTNPGNETEMWSDEFQERVAKAIVAGVNEYLNTWTHNTPEEL